MVQIRPRRSVLYMPGANQRALEKARTLAADCVILDLEDSVAPDAKASARDQVAETVTAGGFGLREVIIRINALISEWGADDLAAAVAAKPDGILVPKVATPEDLIDLGERLDALGAAETIAVWAMMETPLAFFNAEPIAATRNSRSGRRLAAFVLGTNDLAKETRARLIPGRQPMLSWLSTAVLAARAHGLDVIDGVCNEFNDLDVFTAECRQGLDLGMDGKTLIHPKQIEVANAVFAPTSDEIDWAKRIIAAFDEPQNASRGVISLDGRMVERLHAEMAQRVVAIAESVAARQAA
jgi:citrate lyase subunit beta/citryl-CoA lyase